MSLSAPERQALDAIEGGLAESSPSLAAMLTTFSRLAADEEMPPREQVGVRAPSVLGMHQPRPRSHELAKALLLWLVLAVAVVAASSIGLVASHSASRACGDSFVLACTERTNAHRPRPAVHQAGRARTSRNGARVFVTGPSTGYRGLVSYATLAYRA